MLAAFDDDLDTPRALQVLRRLEKDPDVPTARSSRPSPGRTSCSGWTSPDWSAGRDPPPRCRAGAQELLDARAAARGAKDFAASDRLRDELADLGVTVQDTPAGQEWSAG